MFTNISLYLDSNDISVQIKIPGSVFTLQIHFLSLNYLQAHILTY